MAVRCHGAASGATYRLGCLQPQARDAGVNVAFFDELRRRGFIEGQNLTVEYRAYGQHVDLISDYAWTADDHTVSETMLNYFANFIKTGNPNGDKLPEWPAAEAQDTTPPVMVLDTQSKAMDAKDDARYLFLDKAYKNN